MRNCPTDAFRGGCDRHDVRRVRVAWGRLSARRAGFVLALLCFGVFWAMPARGAVVSATEEAGAERGGREVTDASITLAVEGQLRADDSVPGHLIDVACREGVVTLSGTLHTLRAADRALRRAETVKGVRAVIDRITVDPPVREDDGLRSDVVAALEEDPAVGPLDVRATVDGGTVTLAGVVESWPLKRFCSEVVRGVRGVRAIDNRIEVRSDTDRSDQTLATAIERRLAMDVWIDAGGIEVAVSDGQVTLSGKVGSAAEKRRAAGSSYVPGVVSVDAEGLAVDWRVRDDLRRSKKPIELTDAALALAVQDAVRYDPRVVSDDVRVEVTDHVARLSGRVQTVRGKAAAEEDALNTIGVWRVHNHLRVRPEEAAVADGVLHERVQEALIRDAAVEAMDVSITVRNGKVFLYGNVDSQYEKSQAAETVSAVPGVVAVDNKLTVKETVRPRDDSAIREDVEDELWWSPFIDSDRIEVTVKDGAVTLTGTVEDWHERNLATHNAYEGGAEVVYNELSIGGE